ncbi:MAG: hypothetical protein AB1563_10295, partial [Bacillota bacterium]
GILRALADAAGCVVRWLLRLSFRYVHRGCAYGEFADDGSDRAEYADVGLGLPMAENPIPWMLTVMMGMSGMDAVKLSTAGGPVIWRL